jgi:hypothetical protein
LKIDVCDVSAKIAAKFGDSAVEKIDDKIPQWKLSENKLQI